MASAFPLQHSTWAAPCTRRPRGHISVRWSSGGSAQPRPRQVQPWALPSLLLAAPPPGPDSPHGWGQHSPPRGARSLLGCPQWRRAPWHTRGRAAHPARSPPGAVHTRVGTEPHPGHTHTPGDPLAALPASPPPRDGRTRRARTRTPGAPHPAGGARPRASPTATRGGGRQDARPFSPPPAAPRSQPGADAPPPASSPRSPGAAGHGREQRARRRCRSRPGRTERAGGTGRRGRPLPGGSARCPQHRAAPGEPRREGREGKEPPAPPVRPAGPWDGGRGRGTGTGPAGGRDEGDGGESCGHPGGGWGRGIYRAGAAHPPPGRLRGRPVSCGAAPGGHRVGTARGLEAAAGCAAREGQRGGLAGGRVPVPPTFPRGRAFAAPSSRAPSRHLCLVHGAQRVAELRVLLLQEAPRSWAVAVGQHAGALPS